MLLQTLMLRRLLIVLGVIWASPNTVIGLIIGSIALVGGGKMVVRRNDLAIVFDHVPFGPGGALTLGNCILHTGDTLDSACFTYAHRAGHGEEPVIRLCDHERAHVYQTMVLGPLFLPVYLLCGGISVRNPFERAADHYARYGHGWWPWNRSLGIS
ncbi:MAG: hypothetical protein ABI866_06855 [Dokdonella sp.]